MYKTTFNWGFAELLDIPIRTTLCEIQNLILKPSKKIIQT